MAEEKRKERLCNDCAFHRKLQHPHGGRSYYCKLMMTITENPAESYEFGEAEVKSVLVPSCHSCSRHRYESEIEDITKEMPQVIVLRSIFEG